MGEHRAMLPRHIEASQISALLDSLGEPQPDHIEPLQVTAEYHAIFILSYRSPKADWILRVSGAHIPEIKTRNEVGMMKTISEKTTIPIPRVVHFDASTSNSLGHEYTILERASGISVDKVYDTLSELTKHALMQQLLEVLVQLDALQWNFIGGLAAQDDGSVVPGPVVDETFWQTSDIAEFWGPAESVETLNVQGPFTTFVDYCNAHLEKYIHMIKTHESMRWLRDLIPRLQATITMATDRAIALNDTRLILAHRDLHFANIMFDPETERISSVLDWEFSNIVPAARWNPAHAFLWNGQAGPRSLEEKARLYADFERQCKQRQILVDYKFTPLQEAIQQVVTYVRALTEVCPRAQQKDSVAGWRRSAEEALESLGV
ncbi:kinase-like domain-containing protein [Kockovaella imperatae]|uniref:Kinase-like domain-containing protein n=1 Tax=Kockovaella imperatae TaxID=4999 RepID=A0A1Y1UHI5_9TREE|nr:kinase-like domain-containing protein [Kockovaella imperatae]ORX37513.1 kinase-like domain-containing protein [Kockovaella imperatae]